MAWQFSFRSKNNLDNKVKIMLLDEPDKHLDPKMCEIFFDIVYKKLVKKK